MFVKINVVPASFQFCIYRVAYRLYKVLVEKKLFCFLVATVLECPGIKKVHCNVLECPGIL